MSGRGETSSSGCGTTDKSKVTEDAGRTAAPKSANAESTASAPDEQQPAAETGTEPPPNPSRFPKTKRAYQGLEQQEEACCMCPLWFYGKVPQICCAGLCTVIFVFLGVVLLATSSSAWEQVESYGAQDSQVFFTVETDIESDVFLSYEMPDVYLNHRRYIQSRDDLGRKSSALAGMLSSSSCDDGPEEMSDYPVRWRMENDPYWQSIMNRTGGNAFRPCGLIAAAMFTDTYMLYRAQSGGGWASVPLDETDLALPNDAKLYEDSDGGDLITVSGTSSGILSIDGESSWLIPGAFLEHFKVWYRTPLSPKVRHLWAKVPGGLVAGEYKVAITENSPIWTTTWGVSEKRVVLSGSHTLGSRGAIQVLGAVCLILGCIEALILISFGVLAVLKSQ